MANLDQINKAPIRQLAGYQQKPAKSTGVKSLAQKEAPKKKQIVEEEDDEPLDDFEGFGSLTELVKNKDSLIEKEMESPEVKKEIAEKHEKEKAE